MPLIIYNPATPIGGSVGEQILTSEIQKMYESFQRYISFTSQHFPVVNSEDELRELLELRNDNSKKISVICFCFPHKIPRDISCNLHIALPYFFEIATDLKDYSLPIELWKNILNRVQGILVTSQRMKNSLLKMEITNVPIHVFIPKQRDVKESEFVQKKEKIELPCDGYINTNDGPWAALETPPQSIIERFGGKQWTEELFSSNIGGMDDGNIWPVGFLPIENWGAWAESVDASLILPVSVWGRIQISIDILAIGENIGREITIRIGDEAQKIILKASLNRYQFKFEIQSPVNQVFFQGYVLDQDVDSRGLGIGISQLQIKRNSSYFSKLVNKIKQIMRSSGTRSAEKKVEQVLATNMGPSVTKLEIEGSIYLMELRALDLMFDNWVEIIKCYSLALENINNTNLIIICPSKLRKFICPFANQFFNRIQPRSTLIHFIFLDQPSDIYHSLSDFENVTIIRRADGLEYDSYLDNCHRNWVSIGPSVNEIDNTESFTSTFPVTVRRQIRQLLYGEFLPVVLTSDYDNDQLLKVFADCSQFGANNDRNPRNLEKFLPGSATTDFENYMNLLTEITL